MLPSLECKLCEAKDLVLATVFSTPGTVAGV